MIKIQLVHPPIDKEFQKKQVGYLKSPPVGLHLLENTINVLKRNAQEDISVEVIDGNIKSVGEIIPQLDGDAIGISSWYSNHRNAIKITEAVKNNNPDCMTVMGGPNVSPLGATILNRRSSVDFVLIGNSEYSFVDLLRSQLIFDDLKKKKVAEVSNLYFRTPFGRPVFTFSENCPVNVMIDPDSIHPLYKGNPFPVSFIRGCIKAVKTKRRCSFCSLSYKGLDVMQCETVWRQIRLLWEKHGIDYFFETGDSFIPGYYKKLIETRPEDLSHIKFRIYAGPKQINKKIVEILKRINVKEVFLGFETNSDLLLKKAGKDYGFKDELRALDLLTKAGISIQIPFIFGLPGSTLATEKESYLFAEYAIKNYSIQAVLASLPIPLVGSKLYEMVTGGLVKSDIIDYEELTKRLVDEFSECSFEQIVEFAQKTSALTREAGGFWVTK